MHSLQSRENSSVDVRKGFVGSLQNSKMSIQPPPEDNASNCNLSMDQKQISQEFQKFMHGVRRLDKEPLKRNFLPKLEKRGNERYSKLLELSVTKMNSLLENKGGDKEGREENVFLKKKRRAFSSLKLNSFNEDGNLRVLHITWNMGGKMPKQNLQEQLFQTKDNQHHLVCIASQECSKSILASMWNEDKAKWESLVKQQLGVAYVPIKTITRNAMHMMVFAHQSVFGLIKDVDTSRVCCGVANMCFNKGGLAISFRMVQKSFLFLCCHLTSGQNKSKKRVADFSKIEKNLRLDKSYAYLTEQTTNRFDYVFWSGDFNFRVNLGDSEVKKLLKKEDFGAILKEDQLAPPLIYDQYISQYQEGAIQFPMTYKLSDQSNDYCLEGKHQRIPGWTDRILFKQKKDQPSSLKLLNYDSQPNLMLSDHRPVIAQFQIHFEKIVSRLKKGEQLIETKSKACAIF